MMHEEGLDRIVMEKLKLPDGSFTPALLLSVGLIGISVLLITQLKIIIIHIRK